MNNFIIILLQRIIEILALYLILANINGKNLKESFRDLFTNNQRILYENIVFFVGYSVAISNAIQWRGAMGYSLNLILLPLVGLFLIKDAKLSQAVLANISLAVISGFVMPLNFLISMHYLLNFSLVLFLIILIAHKNYIYKLYNYFSVRKVLINSIYLLAFVFYALPLIFNVQQFRGYEILFVLLFIVFYVIVKIWVNKAIGKEMFKTIELIDDYSYDQLIFFLKERSDYFNQTSFIQLFIMQEKNFSPCLITKVSEKLMDYKEQKIIRTYECRIVGEQIKISISQ